MARRLDLVAGGALALLYLALMSGHLFSIDGLEIYRQALALVDAHSLHFAAPLHWGPLTTSDSKYGIGLSLLYVPTLLALSWLPGVGPATGSGFDLMYRDSLYAVAAAPTHALAMAAAAVFTARLTRRLGGGNRAALWALLLFGIGSPALIYARGDWAQSLTALCWAGALYAAVAIQPGGRQPYHLLLSAAILLAVLTRPVDGALLAAFGFALAAWRAQSWRGPLAAVGAGLALGLAITLLVDWGRFGSPFVTGYEGSGWTTPPVIGLAGALVSPARGLLWEFPAVLLAGYGVLRLARSGRLAAGLLLAGLAGAELLSTALWSTWWGGANWGLRLFVPALVPLAALAGVAIDGLAGRARLLAPAALLGGLLFAVPCVLADLFSGLPGLSNSSLANFQLRTYPPLGAWSGIHHVFGNTIDDQNSVDIIWLRLAGRSHHPIPLAAMAALLAAAAVLAFRARQMAREII